MTVPRTAADSDDTNDSDDEDSIAPPGTITVIPGATYTVPDVSCTGPGVVSGWIDWGRNGTFDAGDASTPAACLAGSASLTWDVPAAVSSGTSYLRLRIAPTVAGVASPTGLTTAGEVEDHVLAIAPQPILRLAKVLPQGRVHSGDQFGLSITGPGGPSSVTTSGTATTASGTATIDPATVGTAYTLTETAAGATQLTSYSTTWSCTNGNPGGQTPRGTGTTFQVTPAVGDDLTCRFTNDAILPGLALVKSAAVSTDVDRDGVAGLGDVVTFSFALTNTGNVPLDGLRVTDRFVAPAGPEVSVSCPASTVVPGASIVCTSSPYVVTQADVDAGAVRNTATATGSPPTGPSVVTSPSSTAIPTPGPSINMVKSADLGDRDGDGLADPGESVVYRFVVTNAGATTLRDVEVDDGPLAALELEVVCPTATLAPGDSMSCTSPTYVVTRADLDAGAVVNVATSTGLTPGGVRVTSPPSTTLVPSDRSGSRPHLPTTGSAVGDTACLALALAGLGGLVLVLRRRLTIRARQAG